MTKPVQIQRYRLDYTMNPGGIRMAPWVTGNYVTHADHVSDKAAALLQVRSLLEAKAAEWNNKYKAGSTDLVGHGMRQAECRCAAELLALAATLGNQGK